MSEKRKDICNECGFKGEGLIYRPHAAKRLNKPTIWYCPDCENTQKYENKSKIRNRILKFLYNSQMNSSEPVQNEDIIKKLSISKDELGSNIKYLEQENLVNMGYATFDGLVGIEITSKGINKIEGNENIAPINQINIRDSPGSVINSNNVSININNSFIKDSFSNLYKSINESEYENKEEIKEKIRELESELQKEEINKSKIQNCMGWLKENAGGITTIAIKIAAAALTGLKM